MFQKTNINGFTLIELLFVVLIIGILASIALPQYQKTVDKSRWVNYLTMADAVVKAQQVYYMANGFYAVNFSDLDIDVSKNCSLGGASGGNELLCGFGFNFDNVAN